VPNKTDMKTVAIVVVGVVLAGLLMAYARKNSIPVVEDATDGFDS